MGAMAPPRIAERARLRCRTRRSRQVIRVRMLDAAARAIRSATLAFWFESRDRRPSPRPCMSWRSCGAICAGMCSRRRRRKAWARRSTMRRRQAWIALLRYGSGVPWYRLQGLEKSLGIPLPVATQCEIVAETAVILQPALQELTRQAAQGEVVHNDDTSMRVLS